MGLFLQRVRMGAGQELGIWVGGAQLLARQLWAPHVAWLHTGTPKACG